MTKQGFLIGVICESPNGCGLSPEKFDVTGCLYCKYDHQYEICEDLFQADKYAHVLWTYRPELYIDIDRIPGELI